MKPYYFLTFNVLLQYIKVRTVRDLAKAKLNNYRKVP